MRPWDGMLDERDLAVFQLCGHGRKQGFGKRPVVLVIDATYDFIGDKPEPILESVKRFPNSCGEEGWNAVKHIAELVSTARSRKIPVMYTRGESREDGFDLGAWRNKHARAHEGTSLEGELGSQLAESIAPRPGDLTISKKKPSAFYGTSLISYLIDLKADTVIVVGCTTSGCVRATVVDGFSYGFRMAVVEEGTFDRYKASHAINLFDMNAKYADVVPLSETVAYLRGCPTDLYQDCGLDL